jgi:hypothetical protein
MTSIIRSVQAQNLLTAPTWPSIVLYIAAARGASWKLRYWGTYLWGRMRVRKTGKCVILQSHTTRARRLDVKVANAETPTPVALIIAARAHCKDGAVVGL